MRAGSTFIKLGSEVAASPPSTTSRPATSASAIATSNVWTHIHASLFDLRTGPNYDKHKLKAPSEDSLMDLVGIDLVQCDTRIDHIASKVALNPAWSYPVPGTTIPSLVVVNVQLPSNFSGSLFTEITDGNGWSLVFYYRLKDDVAASLTNRSASPAASLWARYASEVASTNKTAAAWAGRFKVIISCENLDDFKLPSFITSYNAKPVLIRNTAEFYRRDCYLEIDVNVHKFGNVPKKALETLISRFDKMVINVGFCIESRNDDEMPECLFGCAQLIRPLYTAAPHWRDVQLPQPHIVSVPYGKKPHIDAVRDDIAMTGGSAPACVSPSTRGHSLSSPLPAATTTTEGMAPPPTTSTGTTSTVTSRAATSAATSVITSALPPAPPASSPSCARLSASDRPSIESRPSASGTSSTTATATTASVTSAMAGASLSGGVRRSSTAAPRIVKIPN